MNTYMYIHECDPALTYKTLETDRETDTDLRWHWLEVGTNVFPSSHLIQSGRLVVPFTHTRHAGTASEQFPGMTKKYRTYSNKTHAH